jgi:hypothetical protein
MSQDAAPQSTAAKLTISGSTSFHISAFSQKAKSSGEGDNKVGKGQGYNFSQDDSSLSFAFAGSTDSGIDYLGYINFTGQSGSSTATNNYSVRSRVRQNYVQLTAFGATIQGGSLWGTETTSISDGSGVLGGDGGFGSNWSSRFNEPFIPSGSTGNMVYGSYLAGTSNAANKLTIITPTVFGFHLSASLTPNTSQTGDMAQNNSVNAQGKDISSTSFSPGYFDVGHQAYAISYTDHFGEFNVALSASTVLSNDTRRSDGTSALTDSTTYNKTKGYYFGGLISAFGFNLGAGMYDNKNTGVFISESNTGRDGGKVWNVGLGWSAGQWAIGLGYLNGQRNNGIQSTGANRVTGIETTSKAEIYSLTADMRLAEGLTVYGDLNYAKMTDGSIKDSADGKAQSTNKGTVFLLGTRVNF